MPKAHQFFNSTRTVVVPLTFEDDDGQRLTENFKVIYRAMSPKVWREMTEIEKANERNIAASLAGMVVSIPDIHGEDDQPIPITEESLDRMTQDNLLAIQNAILHDINPTAALPPSAPSPSISEPERATQSN